MFDDRQTKEKRLGIPTVTIKELFILVAVGNLIADIILFIIELI
jgi:hypothetical protein